MSEWWRVLMQHCNTATRQRDKGMILAVVLPRFGKVASAGMFQVLPVRKAPSIFPRAQ